ncbi:hypothetical protein CW708_01035 [Candidatus Bathyarchaeota archaeon]|nr:MAG: hypothetical protein CW708_01035 [Candidatus Bathyarchaeota archaeon]
MTANEKILKSLKSAMNYLENSVAALNKKDENLIADSIWHVAAELEYALFLFSIMFQDDVDKSKWKFNSKPQLIELDWTIKRVKELLSNAEKLATSKNFLEAYKEAYIARRYILEVQKSFAKKKREELKKKLRK